MALPNVLIIGAMKAGTTTLWRDLLPHPELCFPRLRKEPQVLARRDLPPREIRRRYRWFFDHARPGQLVCDPSMRYAARPKFRGVARRARRLLGPDLRIIYMVREPIARVVSHHHHGYADGWLPPSIDRAVHRNRQLVSLSRYAFQLDPWLERFGQERLHVIHLESYAADRRAGVAEVCGFLGLDPQPVLARLRPDVIHNRGVDRRARRGPGMALIRSPVYQRMRPHIPVPWDRQLRRWLLPPVAPRPTPPNPDTVRFIADSVADDLERLRCLLASDRPLWDMDRAIREWTEHYHATVGDHADEALHPSAL